MHGTQKLTSSVISYLVIFFALTLSACSGDSGGLPETAPADVAGPKVLTIDPQLNAIDISTNRTRITVEFDENLNEKNILPYSVTLTAVSSTVGKSIVGSEVPLTFRVELNKLVVNFSNTVLSEKTKYIIEIRELEDISGNVMDVYSSTFSTRTPPFATIKPVDQAIPVSRSEAIVVEFSEIMDEASLSTGFELVELLANSVVSTSYKFSQIDSPLKVNHQIVANKSIATYTFVDPKNPTQIKLFAASAQYTVNLSQNQTVKDVNGNSLAPTSVLFSTGFSDKIGKKPEKPGVVTVKTTLVTNSGVFNNEISWLPAASSNNTGKAYNVYLSLNDGRYQQIAANLPPLVQTLYTHESVIVGAKYKYAISVMDVLSEAPKTYGPESEFSYSNVVIPDAKAPVAITAIAGPALSAGNKIADGIVELSWDSVQGKKYNLYVKEGNTAFVKLSGPILANAIQTSYPIAKGSYSPGNDIQFQYAVTLLTANGNESAQTISNIVVPFTAPTLKTPNGIDRTVTVTWPVWTNVPGLSYTLYASVDGGNFNLVATGLVAGQFIHGKGAAGTVNQPLVYGSIYSYKVAAVSTVGTSVRTSDLSLSSASVTILAPAAKPLAPINVKAIAGDASVLLTWDLIVGKNYDYRIYQKQGGATNFILVKTLTKPITGSTRVSAVNNTLNIFQIAAVDLNIEGTRTETVGVTPVSKGAVISAWNHSCVVKLGKLWCWGENLYGQIGNNTQTYSEKQTNIGIPTAEVGALWIAVTTGERHTCGILNNGIMYCWGESGSGQLGNGTTSSTNVLIPTKVAKPTVLGATELVNWTQVTAGRFTTCAIHSNAPKNGQLFCWGDNSYDQLGIAPQTPKIYNVAQPEPVIPALGVVRDSDWIEVRAAERHTCGIRQQAGKNTLWCWGSRSGGRLGDGDSSNTARTSIEPLQVVSGIGGIPETDWSSIALGSGHTCGIRSTTNTLWCWGLNNGGQLGNNNIGFRTPVPIQEFTLANDWIKVFANNAQTCGLKLSGEISCWGANYYGQAGTGTVSLGEFNPTTFSGNYNWVSIAVGIKHTCGITDKLTPNDVLCWGTAEKFALGTTTSEVALPIQVGKATDWLTATAGSQNGFGFKFTLGLRGILDNNSMFSWGSNQSGILGNGDTTFLPAQTPIAAADNTSWDLISAGQTHACGIKTNLNAIGGNLYCWGTGGQLGNNSFDTAVPQIVGIDNWLTVDVGASHSCGIKSDGSLWCWGYGYNGELGAGATVDSVSGAKTPIVPDNVNTFLIQVVNPSVTTTWSSVSAGVFYTCAIDTSTNAKLYCWGFNQSGNLATGDLINKFVPTEVLNPEGVTSSWISVSTGSGTTCALTNGGNQNLYCWGSNAYGAIGNSIATLPNQLTPRIVQTVTDSTASGTPWATVSISTAHTCARKTDSPSNLPEEGSLWCWGNNFNGETGRGIFDIKADNRNIALRQSRERPTRVAAQSYWKDFTTGSYHTCAVKADNTLWCWGSNSGGQLGSGNAWKTSPVSVSIP